MAAGPASWPEQFRVLRLRARLTQEELADRAGVSVRTVRNLESGRIARPHAGSLRALAAALGLSENLASTFEAAAWSTDEVRDPLGPGHGSIRDVVPAMLPLAVPALVGRERELAELDRLLDGLGPAADDHLAPSAVTVLCGTAGVGKTTLAVSWAHRVRGEFPDGQLYIDLHGFDRSGSPMSSADALRVLLEMLGVPDRSIPVELSARAGMYRSLLEGHRILVVLDNAFDSDQVRPLIPGTRTARVVITSRSALLGLVATADARLLPVELLTADEARRLLEERMPITVDDRPAVEEIVRVCAGLPLALVLLAARARLSPGRTPAELTAEIRGSPDPFHVMGADQDTDLRKVFGWSYRMLSSTAATVFRRSGLHPAVEFPLTALAALADLPPPRAARALQELITAHLVSEVAPHRYRTHDLLHAFAADLTADMEPPDERRAALHRMFDHYLHTAMHADRRLAPHRDPITVPGPVPGSAVTTITDRQEALAWFTAEHDVIARAVVRATEEGFDPHAWRLAWALVEFLDIRGMTQDNIETHKVAVSAARRLGDLDAQARALRLLANATVSSGDLNQARSYLHEALDLSAAGDDLPGQANIHLNLSVLYERLGQHPRANRHSAHALKLFQRAGHRSGEAVALDSLGYGHALIGELDSALTLCIQSLRISRELCHRKSEAHTLDSLGYIHARMNQPALASEYYLQAVILFRELTDRPNQAGALLKYGDARQATGDTESAATAWQEALRILEELQDPQATEARRRLKHARP